CKNSTVRSRATALYNGGKLRANSSPTERAFDKGANRFSSPCRRTNKRLTLALLADAKAPSPCQGVPYIHSSPWWNRRIIRSSLRISDLRSECHSRAVVLFPAPEWPRNK